MLKFETYSHCYVTIINDFVRNLEQTVVIILLKTRFCGLLCGLDSLSCDKLLIIRVEVEPFQITCSKKAVFSLSIYPQPRPYAGGGGITLSPRDI